MALKALVLHLLIALAWLLGNSLRPSIPESVLDQVPGLDERGPRILEISFATAAPKPTPPAPQTSPASPEVVRDALPPRKPAPAPKPVAKPAPPVTQTAQKPPPSAAPAQPIDPAGERAVTQARPAEAAPAELAVEAASRSESTSAGPAPGEADSPELPGTVVGSDALVASSLSSSTAQTSQPSRSFVGGIRDDLPWAYRWQVKSALSRLRRYPRKAYSSQQQGTAVVRIHLARSGELLDVSLLRSSGHALLDQEAIDVVKRVGRFAALSDSVLPGMADFAIDQPIGFELRR